MGGSFSRVQALAYRMQAQQLDHQSRGLADTALLDLGVQDTGPDGALWALTLRGVDTSGLSSAELAKVWTVRGAPHLYRRHDLPAIAAAVAPFSDADAGKRIFDASKPLKAAEISNLDALDAVAELMRSVVKRPLVKGEVSTRVTALAAPPYLRFCRPCDATHLYEQPFRLAALQAGLELELGTSPPVLRPIPDFEKAEAVPERFDVVRGYLRLLGPATPQHVAAFLDASVRDVKARWPDDAVEVRVEGQRRWLLAADRDGLASDPHTGTVLLGPFDLFLQAKDRELLVDDRAYAKQLWPRLGRPGAVLLNGEVAGSWRPRKSGKSLRVVIELWRNAPPAARTAMSEQAERLADFRQTKLAGVELS